MFDRDYLLRELAGDLAREQGVPQQAPPTPQQEMGAEIEDIPVTGPAPHKGMFGIKGGLRDVLGLLGDAFLTQAGNDRIYAKKRREEDLGDNLRGFADNPMAAIQRLAETGHPEEAQSLYKEMSLREEKRRMNDSLLADRQFDNDVQAEKIIGGMLATGNETNWPMLVSRVKDYAGKKGYDISHLNLSNTYDPNAASVLRGFGTNANSVYGDQYKNARLPQIDRGLDISEGKATEQVRHNTATEGIQTDRNTEQGRSNRAREGIANDRNDISRSKGGTGTDWTGRPKAAPKSGGAGALPSPRKAGDKIKHPTTGLLLMSTDGKTWSQKSKDGKTWSPR